jgi:hypothetical protein
MPAFRLFSHMPAFLSAFPFFLPCPQVWQPKAAQVQTRTNKGQSMPKKLQYVAGLRGAPNTKMNVIRLEMDLGQPHQH